MKDLGSNTLIKRHLRWNKISYYSANCYIVLAIKILNDWNAGKITVYDLEVTLTSLFSLEKEKLLKLFNEKWHL